MLHPYNPEYGHDQPTRSQKISFCFGVCLALMFFTAQPAWPDATAPRKGNVVTRSVACIPMHHAQSSDSPSFPATNALSQ